MFEKEELFPVEMPFWVAVKIYLKRLSIYVGIVLLSLMIIPGLAKILSGQFTINLYYFQIGFVISIIFLVISAAIVITGGVKWQMSGGDMAPTQNARNQIITGLISFGIFLIATIVFYILK